MDSRFFRLLIVGLISGSLGNAFTIPACVAADEIAVAPKTDGEGVFIASLEPGFGWTGRIGQGMPVSVQVRGAKPGSEIALRVTASDPHGHLCENTVASGIVPDSGVLSLTGVFRIGRLSGDVRFQILDVPGKALLTENVITVSELSAKQLTTVAGEVPSSLVSDGVPPRNLKIVRQSCQTLLAVGQPSGVAEVQQNLAVRSNDAPPFLLMSLPDLSAFPNDPRAFQSVDYILLADEFELTEEQTNAMQLWVEDGGHLIVCAGGAVDKFRRSRLGQVYGEQFGLQDGTASARDLSALQDFVRGAVQLQTNRRIVPVARVGTDQARVIVSSLEGPLVSRRSEGRGVITFVSLDVNQKPLSGWPSLSMFYELLLFERLSDTGTGNDQDRSVRISSSGMSDLGTQLQAVYDAIGPESRWSSWHIMSMMAVYVLIIGPLDYAIVVLLLKRAHLTWITFPISVGLGCFLIWQVASHDTGLILERQLDVVDVSDSPVRTGIQTVSVRSWASISSDSSRRAEVSVRPSSLLPSNTRVRDLSWYGRAEDVYGGMYRQGGIDLGRQTYSLRDVSVPDGGRLTGVPLLANGSFTVAAEMRIASDADAFFSADLKASMNGLLDGSFRSHLSAPIADWIVVYGNRLYEPSADATGEDRILEPNEEWNRNFDWVRVSSVSTSLKGTRFVRRKSQEGSSLKGASSRQNTPYNAEGRDPLEILLMASLYETAGGESYVKLRSDQLRSLEFSDSIRLNHALLIGRLQQSPAEFPIDGQEITPEQTDTIVRFLIPVKRVTVTENTEAVRPDAVLPTSPSTGN